jgi:hypothetical protein
MRIHGVSVDFIKEIRALGYPDVTVPELVKLRIHGVTPEFIKEVREAGYKEMSVGDLVDFSIHGRRWLRKRG